MINDDYFDLAAEHFGYVPQSEIASTDKEVLSLADFMREKQLVLPAVHTCHDLCQRPACVLRRELAAVKRISDDLSRAATEQMQGLCDDNERLREAGRELTDALMRRMARDEEDRAGTVLPLLQANRRMLDLLEQPRPDQLT